MPSNIILRKFSQGSPLNTVAKATYYTMTVVTISEGQ